MEERARLSDGEALSFATEALGVGLIGTGRVGTAIGRTLSANGHPIVAVAARTDDSMRAAAETFRTSATDVAGVARAANLVVIAVPDDALNEVAADVARVCTPETWVVHTCGRSGTEPLRACGDRVAAIHPAAPVASDRAGFEGIPFGVTCADNVLPFAEWFVAELGGTSVRVPEADRVLYHAALVIASNFTTALAGDAIDLAGRAVVLPLLRATLDNLDAMEPNDALTGPVVRGDAGTVRAHVQALRDAAPALLEVYRANSRRLLERAKASGRLDDVRASQIEEALA